MGGLAERTRIRAVPAGSSAGFLQEALDKFDVVALEPGTFALGTGQLVVPPGTELRGAGTGAVGKTQVTSALTAGPFIELQGNTVLRNMEIVGPGNTVGTADGVEFTGFATNDRCFIDSVDVTDFGGTGIFNMRGSMRFVRCLRNGVEGCRHRGSFLLPDIIQGCRFASNLASGLIIVDGAPGDARDVSVVDCFADGNGVAGLIASGSGFERIHFTRCLSDSNAGRGIDIQANVGANDCYISYCVAQGNTVNGIEFRGPGVFARCQISNCYAEANTINGIIVQPTFINQVRIADCFAHLNGNIGIVAAGALPGGDVNLHGFVSDNHASANTASNFSINASYHSVDNLT